MFTYSEPPKSHGLIVLIFKLVGLHEEVDLGALGFDGDLVPKTLERFGPQEDEGIRLVFARKLVPTLTHKLILTE